MKRDSEAWKLSGTAKHSVSRQQTKFSRPRRIPFFQLSRIGTTHLLEPDVRRLLAECLPRHVQSVLADDAALLLVAGHTAVAQSPRQQRSRNSRCRSMVILPADGSFAHVARAREVDCIVRHCGFVFASRRLQSMQSGLLVSWLMTARSEDSTWQSAFVRYLDGRMTLMVWFIHVL